MIDPAMEPLALGDWDRSSGSRVLPEVQSTEFRCRMASPPSPFVTRRLADRRDSMENFFLQPSTIAVIFHGIVVALLSIRVIMRRPQTGIALAWLLLIAGAPFLGAVIYLLIGERRIGRHRTLAIESLRRNYVQFVGATMQKASASIDWSRHPPAAKSLDQLGRHLIGVPTVPGTGYQLVPDSDEALEWIARDIDAAATSVLMEFYIWQRGGKADDVLEALIRAAQRGVYCCVLIDALGARPWWRSHQPARLRAAGVHLRPALPVGLFRTLFGRTDLRMHRKIVVIDSRFGWTGSMNLVDPRLFKQNAGVGQWIDAMVRLQGPAIVPLAATMLSDWILETDQTVEDLIRHTGIAPVAAGGTADIQVVPSGPGESKDGLLQMVLTLVNFAERNIVLTTPYLVPDDSLLRALCGAAARGVDVQMIVPRNVDSILTRYASRSYFDDLLDYGVQIYWYHQGLLHTKSITVDESLAMFGTVNLDMRSIWLNYEVALFVYDPDFVSKLRSLQHSYRDVSQQLDRETWEQRSFSHRFLENTFRLLSPLL